MESKIREERLFSRYLMEYIELYINTHRLENKKKSIRKSRSTGEHMFVSILSGIA